MVQAAAAVLMAVDAGGDRTATIMITTRTQVAVATKVAPTEFPRMQPNASITPHSRSVPNAVQGTTTGLGVAVRTSTSEVNISTQTLHESATRMREDAAANPSQRL